MRHRLTRAVVAFVALAVLRQVTADARTASTPEDLARAAVGARVAIEGAEITVLAIDLPAGAKGPYKSARLDPGAIYGRPMRASFVPVTGPAAIGVVTARVIADQVVAARDLARGEVIRDADVVVRRGEIRNVPLRRLPGKAEVVGGRALRDLPSGTILMSGAVVLRRVVERGDSVTAVARIGQTEISAVVVAIEGGDPGDVIRVTNPESKRALRARIVNAATVEVIHGR
jgi:flagella basal body P-ring formation protein FlgA